MNSWNGLRLNYAPPGAASVHIATVIYTDDCADVHWHFRDEWQMLIHEEDSDFFQHLEEQFAQMMAEMKGPAFIRWVEETLSNVLRAEGPFPLKEGVDKALSQ